MDSLDLVLDPSDWLTTKLPPLYQLDSMIRCHICKEFMNSPVLTGCGHCFCSLCIRSSLASMGKCPLCNEEQFESNLRKNLILEEVIVFFKKNREDLMSLLSVSDKLSVGSKEDVTEIQPTPELINLDSDDENENDKRTISAPSSSRKRQRRPMTVTEQIAQSQKESKSENLSECPICHNFLPLSELETTHIDICLSNNNNSNNDNDNDKADDFKTQVPPSSYPAKKTTLSRFFVEKKQPVTKTTTTAFDKNKQYQIQHVSNTTSNKPLKKLNFSSLNTSKLKEKLSLLSLPTMGSRQQLESRYNQYVILYNANLDSINPVPLKKLRASLNQWEFLNNNMDGNLQVTTVQKNVDRSNWLGTYNDEFKKLILRAKNNGVVENGVRQENTKVVSSPPVDDIMQDSKDDSSLSDSVDSSSIDNQGKGNGINSLDL